MFFHRTHLLGRIPINKVAIEADLLLCLCLSESNSTQAEMSSGCLTLRLLEKLTSDNRTELEEDDVFHARSLEIIQNGTFFFSTGQSEAQRNSDNQRVACTSFTIWRNYFPSPNVAHGHANAQNVEALSCTNTIIFVFRQRPASAAFSLSHKGSLWEPLRSSCEDINVLHICSSCLSSPHAVSSLPHPTFPFFCTPGRDALPGDRQLFFSVGEYLSGDVRRGSPLASCVGLSHRASEGNETQQGSCREGTANVTSVRQALPTQKYKNFSIAICSTSIKLKKITTDYHSLISIFSSESLNH